MQDRGESLGDEDTRTLVDLLVEQIEFANVILWNKIDLVSSEELATVHSIIRGLNAKAKVIETKQSSVDMTEVMGTGLYNLEEAQEHPLWAQELYRPEAHVPETEEYGITSFVYRARAPFDPEKYISSSTRNGRVLFAQKAFLAVIPTGLVGRCRKPEPLSGTKVLVVGGRRSKRSLAGRQ